MPEILADNYRIFITNEIGKSLNRYFKAKKSSFSKLFILVDENSLSYCYPLLAQEVEILQSAEILEIESGEESKNIEVCSQLWSALSELGADRKSLIVNLGGGVVSDMGGFIASTFKRGIQFINIPTTLLSQVDASVGGKVGVDLNNIKNEIGVFNNPDVVFINSKFLKTLPKRQLLSGFAEVLKHALIADKMYWEEIKLSNVFNEDDWDDLIEKSVKIKNKIVQKDPFEKDIRKALNFGHTIGHAIESYSLEQPNAKKLLHGECVAVGMICEAYISCQNGKLKSNELKEITDLILSYYNSINIKDFQEERLLELMKHDKKNLPAGRHGEKGEIYFTMLTSIGVCEVNKTAKPDIIKESLKYYKQQMSVLK